MNTRTYTMAMTFVLAVSILTANSNAQRPDSDNGRRQGPPQSNSGRNFLWSLPVIKALDSNGDKIISDKELKIASESLIKLDKNGDGNLTIDEIRPNFGSRPSRPPSDPENRPRPETFAPVKPKITKSISGHSTKDILKLLGAKGIEGAQNREIQSYRRLFSFTDKDKDGKHSKTEYIDNGRYLTPESRAGMFSASDTNGDGFVSEKEYINNRIITDEAKSIFESMDSDKNSRLSPKEFMQSGNLKGKDLAKEVYSAFDSNSNGELILPEYLRVWGTWARQ
jgi:Ca2+-binding EF-hand superfamily protein